MAGSNAIVTISGGLRSCGPDISKGTDAKHSEASGVGSPDWPCRLSKSSFQELSSCRCIQILYSPAGIVTSPKARLISVLKVVEVPTPICRSEEHTSELQSLRHL